MRVLDTVPRTVKGTTGSRAVSSRARAGGGTAATTEVRRNVGGTSLTRSVALGGVLRLVEGKISHLQTVGHFCGWISITEGEKNVSDACAEGEHRDDECEQFFFSASPKSFVGDR